VAGKERNTPISQQKGGYIFRGGTHEQERISRTKQEVAPTITWGLRGKKGGKEEKRVYEPPVVKPGTREGNNIREGGRNARPPEVEIREMRKEGELISTVPERKHQRDFRNHERGLTEG